MNPLRKRTSAVARKARDLDLNYQVEPSALRRPTKLLFSVFDEGH